MVFIMALLATIVIFIFVATWYIIKVKEEKDAENIIVGANKQKAPMYFPWETYMLKRIDIKEKHIIPIFLHSPCKMCYWSHHQTNIIKSKPLETSIQKQHNE